MSASDDRDAILPDINVIRNNPNISDAVSRESSLLMISSQGSRLLKVSHILARNLVVSILLICVQLHQKLDGPMKDFKSPQVTSVLLMMT